MARAAGRECGTGDCASADGAVRGAGAAASTVNPAWECAVSSAFLWSSNSARSSTPSSSNVCRSLILRRTMSKPPASIPPTARAVLLSLSLNQKEREGQSLPKERGEWGSVGRQQRWAPCWRIACAIARVARADVGSLASTRTGTLASRIPPEFPSDSCTRFGVTDGMHGCTRAAATTREAAGASSEQRPAQRPAHASEQRERVAGRTSMRR